LGYFSALQSSNCSVLRLNQNNILEKPQRESEAIIQISKAIFQGWAKDTHEMVAMERKFYQLKK
jgi:hypothetical protein